MLNMFCLKSLLLTAHMALGQDAATTQVVSATADIGKIYACPRCRRATPPGPRKRASPGKEKDSTKEKDSK